jgi:hypothetical protein
LEHCRVRGLVFLLVQRDPVPVLGTRGAALVKTLSPLQPLSDGRTGYTAPAAQRSWC